MGEMIETPVSSERLYDGRVIKLDRVQVTLANGKPSMREIVRHPGAVAIIAVDDAGQILLVRQFRLAAGRVMLEIPAGTLEPGEDPLACAERELQEETGYRPGKLQPLGGFFVAPGYTTEFIHLFLATELSESRLDMDEDENLEVSRLPLSESLAQISSGDIQDGKSIIGILRYQAMINP